MASKNAENTSLQMLGALQELCWTIVPLLRGPKRTEWLGTTIWEGLAIAGARSRTFHRCSQPLFYLSLAFCLR